MIFIRHICLPEDIVCKWDFPSQIHRGLTYDNTSMPRVPQALQPTKSPKLATTHALRYCGKPKDKPPLVGGLEHFLFPIY